ncbi:MAG TPA: IS5 family transposase [Pyrinomonadaceae bacterium]
MGVCNQRYPTDLTDSQWHLIKDWLPPPARTGRPRLDLREVINAVCYVLKGGIQWRMMPTDFPKWQSVYSHFRRWRTGGIWRRVHDALRAQARCKAGRHKHPTAGCLDSQSVKTTAEAAPGTRGSDANKRVTGRKRHVLTDTTGLLLVAAVTPANVQDKAGALVAFRRLGGGGKKLRRVWADGAYRTTRGHLASWVERRGISLTAVERPEGQRGFQVLPRRWVVERTFAWLSQSRRLGKDYERLAETSEALVYIAMTRLMLRRLAPK